jgi:hypothetical protein
MNINLYMCVIRRLEWRLRQSKPKRLFNHLRLRQAQATATLYGYKKGFNYGL